MMYVIAGFMHDLDHRGTTNSFHIHGRELTQCYLSRLKLLQNLFDLYFKEDFKVPRSYKGFFSGVQYTFSDVGAFKFKSSLWRVVIIYAGVRLPSPHKLVRVYDILVYRCVLEIKNSIG